MTFREICNKKHLNRILKNWEQLVRDGLPSYNNLDCQIKDIRSFLPIIKSYLKKIKTQSKIIRDNVVEIPVDYKPSVGEKDHYGNKYFGRVYPDSSVGLISFSRTIRNYCLLDDLGNPLILDMDIRNCHPTIWLQFLQKNGYTQEKLNYLIDYCNNRTQWIEYYAVQEPLIDVKLIVISSINGNNQLPLIESDLGLRHGPNLSHLCREIQDSLDWVSGKWNLTDLGHIKKFVYSTNTKIEREIIDIVLEYCREVGILVRMYCYDGFCIDNLPTRDETWIENFQQTLSKIVWEKLNYKIEFVQKKFSWEDRPIRELVEILNSPKSRRTLENEIEFKLEPNEYIMDVCQKELDIECMQPGTITVLKASMGLGKTYALYKMLKAHVGKKTIISILNRISLIKSITSKYDWTESYLDACNEKIHGVDKFMVICAESLHRLTQNTLQKVDVLILDEFTSVIPQMLSVGTHGKNLNVNQLILWSLIRNCEKIFIMDANISQEALNFIKQIRSDGRFSGEKTIFKNIFFEPRKERKVKMYEDYDFFLEQFRNRIRLGQKLFVPSTISILKMETILDHCCDGKPYLYINQENRDDEDIKEYINNPQKWNEFDVVCISPTITSGISCDIPNYFDETWCFFTSNTSSPFDSCQMIDRVRNIRSTEIHIHLTKKINLNYPRQLTKKQILGLIYNNQRNLFNKNFHPDNLCDIKWNFDTYQSQLVVNQRFELFSYVYSTLSWEYHNFEEILKVGLNESYIITDWEEITILADTKDKSLQEDLVSRKEQNAINILFSPMLTWEESVEYERNFHTHKDEYKKYNMVKSLSPSRCITDEDIGRFENLVKFQTPKFQEGVLGDEREVQKCKGLLEKNIIPQYKCLSKIFNNACPTTDTGLFNGLDNNEIRFDLESKYTDFTLNDLEKYGTQEFTKSLNGFYSGVLDVQFLLTDKETGFGLNSVWEHKIFTNEEMINTEKNIMENLLQRGSSDKLTRYSHIFKLDIDQIQKKIKTYPLEPQSPIFMSEINKIIGHIGLFFYPKGNKRVDLRHQEGEKRKQVRINESYELGLKFPVILDTRLPTPKKPSMPLDCLPVLRREKQRLLLYGPDKSLEEVLVGDEQPQNEPIFTENGIQNYKNSVFYHLM